jgi:RNA polymerase sigma-70 factor (ECF subfamily)
MPDEPFDAQLLAQLRSLRRYAMSLTRDPIRTDDLVQDTLTRALAKQHLWEPGTDLRAWLFTILHNQHVAHLRDTARQGISVPLDAVAGTLTINSNAMAMLELRDVVAAIAKLPQQQRELVLLVGLEGMRYEQVADALGLPIGTVRSRLWRGRDQIRRHVS